MRLVLALLASVVALPVSADAIYQDERVSIRLMDKPCQRPSLAKMFADNGMPKARAAVVQLDGRSLVACWAVLQGAAVVADEEGSGGAIPLDQFTVPKSV